MGGGTVTRRDFMKTTGVGAVATGLGANIIFPGRANAAKKKLRIVQWVHFVPAYDEWFNKKYAVEWGQKNDTEVTVDNIGIAGINARAAAEVSAQKGHDLFLFNWPPPSFEEQTVDMKDVYQELERKLGKPIDLGIKSTYNPKTKKYYAFSPSFTPDPVNYRQDLFSQVGLPNGPRSWDEVRSAGAKIKKQFGNPVAIGLEHVMQCYVVWKFAENIEGAKKFLVDYTTSFKDAFLAGEFYDFPCFPKTVPDLTTLISNDTKAHPPDKYKVFDDVLNWATNVGYPG